MAAPRSRIDYGRMLDVIGIEGELMLSTAVSALPAGARAEVPGCPELTLAQTLRHVGEVYRTTRQWARAGRRAAQPQRSPADADLVGFVRTGLLELLRELGMHDPAEPCETWWPEDQTHGFWRRRMVHETTVHRVDVEAAAGGPVHPVAPDVALDGVDEVLLAWFGHRLDELGMSSPKPGVVALSAADQHWLAIFEPGGCTARRVEGRFGTRSADAMISGEAREIYLWCWGRLPDQSVQIVGDQEAVGRLWALLRLATQ